MKTHQASRITMRLLLITLAVVLASLGSTWALADNMSVTYHGSQSATYWVDGQQKNALTAEFYTPTSYQNLTWFGYCMDPLQSFQNPIQPGDPNAWTGPEVNPAPLAYDWKEAAWLMENFAPGVTWLDDNSAVNYDSAAVKNAIQAVQFAIWETLLDHSATYTASDLTDASSRFRVGSGAIAAQAGSYLVALSEHKTAHGGQVSLSGTLNFKINDQSDRQDLIVGSQAPEPATLLLLASALATTGGLLRRRRKKS